MPETNEIRDMNETIINRETLNGTKWQIVADNYGAALYLNNFGKPGFHYSGYWFRTIEEAQAHLDAVDERCRTPKQEYKPVVIPADYYGVRGRYYGD